MNILRSQSCVTAQVVLSFGLLLASSSAALPLVPNYEMSRLAQAGNTYQPGPPTSGTTGAGEPCDFFAPGCFSSAIVTQQLLPSPSMGASGSSQNGGHGIGSGYIRYFFEVVGPAGLVPVHVQGSAQVSGSGVYNSQAEIAVFSSSGTLLAGGTACENVYVSCDPAAWFLYNVSRRSSISVDETISVTATDPSASVAEYYSILVGAYADSSGGGSASAKADPILFFDPDFANASQYQIIVSQGVGVPEPAAVLLVLTAIAGAVTRRGRSGRA